MKRTKQAFYKDHDDVPKFVSGCRQFAGEDVCKYLYFYLSLKFQIQLLIVIFSLCRAYETECRTLTPDDH